MSSGARVARARPTAPRTRWPAAVLVALPGLAIAAAAAQAQSPGPIVTDRPDQTESAVSVAARHVQIEFGWRYADSGASGGDVTSHVLPDALIRVGLGAGIEARVGVGGLLVERSPDVAGGGRLERSGFTDASLGVKLELAGGGSGNLALLADVSVPVGEDGFGSERWDPAVLFLASRPLGDRASLGANVGIAWRTTPDAGGPGEHRTVAGLPYTLSLGYGLSGRLGVFVESFGALGLSRDEPDSHSVDAGLTALLSDAVQADVSLGFGLNDAADDMFIGAGLAFRLPG